MFEKEENKRLFFGLEVNSTWPENLPKGRLLQEHERHLTVAFLGNVPYAKVKNFLKDIPKPPFKVGFAGYFDDILFLPPRFPKVVAWHANWLESSQTLNTYCKQLKSALEKHGFSIDKRELLSHVTLCRAPFMPKEWRKAFVSLPCIATHLHLYESLGNLHYQPIWTHAIQAPFEEIEHTADIAFHIYGEKISQLFTHAQIALAFRFPPLISFMRNIEVNSLEEIIIYLNQLVTQADAELGCPFKAVSFHGNISEEPDKTLKWEMIVDV